MLCAFEKVLIMNTEQTKTEARRPGRVVHTMIVWFERPPFVERNEAVEVEHNLMPTDVTNHFSGAPITLLGADVWTCFGDSGKEGAIPC